MEYLSDNKIQYKYKSGFQLDWYIAFVPDR